MLFVLFFFINFLTFELLNSRPAAAQCPVCIVTIGGGMLLAKKLGIDDLLVSIWISALNTAIAFWLASKIKTKFLKNPYLLSFLFLVLTLIYFRFTDQIGHLRNSLFGIDKIILGQILGLLAMFAGNYLYSYAKKLNHNRALFPYSKVVFPVGLVLTLTLFFKIAFHL